MIYVIVKLRQVFVVGQCSIFVNTRENLSEMFPGHHHQPASPSHATCNSQEHQKRIAWEDRCEMVNMPKTVRLMRSLLLPTHSIGLWVGIWCIEQETRKFSAVVVWSWLLRSEGEGSESQFSRALNISCFWGVHSRMTWHVSVGGWVVVATIAKLRFLSPALAVYQQRSRNHQEDPFLVCKY